MVRGIAAAAVAVLTTVAVSTVAQATVKSPRAGTTRSVTEAGGASPHVFLVSDLTGDGIADLVVGAPNATVDGVAGAGKITIMVGHADGLHQTGNILLTEATYGIPVGPDHFGSSVLSGDFNGDSHDDLVIGLSAWTDNGVPDAGALLVAWGSSTGLTTSTQLLTQSAAGTPVQSDAGFGFSLSSSNWLGDQAGDLAVGTPTYDVNGVTDAGEVLVYEGHIGGTLTFAQTLNETNLTHNMAVGDEFGYAIRGGHLNGTAAVAGYRALAIGVPFKDTKGLTDAGAVIVLYGTATGFPTSTEQFWSEDSPGIGGRARAGDLFGFSVATRYITAPYCDIVVGVPGKSSGEGAVNVIYGSSKGLTSSGNQYIWMDTPGVPHVARVGDEFGYDVSVRDLGYGTGDDVAVGVPGSKGVIALYSDSNGIDPDLSPVWLGNSTHGFGQTVSIRRLPGGAEGSVIVGLPQKTVEGLPGAGGVYVAYSASPGGFARTDVYVSESPEAGAAFGTI